MPFSTVTPFLESGSAQMFESAKSEISDGPVVKDVAELVAERL